MPLIDWGASRFMGVTNDFMPFVTVIIPTYNRADLLSEALESVFRQTYRDYEIIVVDDGSTDDTPRITEQYKDKITVIRQTNGGRSRARNAGIAAARGRYIAFLDDDDLWVPRKLEQQVRILEENPTVGLVSCSVHLTREGSPTRTWSQTTPSGLDAWTEQLVLGDGVHNPSTLLIRKDILCRIELFDPNVEPCEDWDLLIRLAFRGVRLHHIEEPMVEYRLHQENSILDLDRMNEARISILKKVFSSPQTPSALIAKRRYYLGRWWTQIGCDSYRLSKFRKACHMWLDVVKVDPSAGPRLVVVITKLLLGPRFLTWARAVKRDLIGLRLGNG
jgi:glycosyltransferase involved in cell wall biosynthesis